MRQRISARQLALGLPEPKVRFTHGGARRGAGARPGRRSRNMPHTRRPTHWRSAPVHMTMRSVRALPSLRAQLVFDRIALALRQASKDGFRVNHFSVQADHIHLIVEADDGGALRRGAQGLAIRAAKAINRVLARKGRLWAGRHERHDLRTRREVRNCLVYVLFNFRKHARGAIAETWARGSLDPRSSALWLDGWSARAGPHLATLAEQLASTTLVPCVPPRVWLLTTGWRQLGLLDPGEAPRSPRGALTEIARPLPAGPAAPAAPCPPRPRPPCPRSARSAPRR